MSEAASPFEVEFERRLSALGRDSVQCAGFAFTDFVQMHFEGDEAVLDRFNAHAGFWMRVKSALQVSIFITLARMFDRTQGTDTIRSLIDYGEKHHGLISLKALCARKVRMGVPLEDARTLVTDLSEVPRSVWEGLRQAAEDQEKTFDAHARTIRHEVFAHSTRITVSERDAAFTGLRLRTLEELCVFPLRIHNALIHLYFDGRLPELSTPPTKLADVLKALPGPSVSTWDHLHVAKDAADFFRWFGTTPHPKE